MSFEQLMITYGYPILFVGVLIEGEAFLIAGAYLAHKGYFSTPLVILLAALASVLISQLYFYLGQHYGQPLLNRRPQWQPRFSRVQNLLTNYGAILIVGFRALYGLRIVIPASVGATGYSGLTFLFFNSVGGILWAGLIVLLGTQLLSLIEPLWIDIRHHERLVAGILGGLGLAWGAYQIYRQSRLAKERIVGKEE